MQPLSTRANERRGRRRRLPGRGGAGAGPAVSWLESLEHRLEGDGCGWGGTGLSGDQGEENKMEWQSLAWIKEVKPEL